MSGATREVTEGVSALVAAAILLYVGVLDARQEPRAAVAGLSRSAPHGRARRPHAVGAGLRVLPRRVPRGVRDGPLLRGARRPGRAGRGRSSPCRPRRRGRSPPRARLAHRPRQRGAALRPLLRRQRRAARAALRRPRGQGRGRAPGGGMDRRSRGAASRACRCSASIRTSRASCCRPSSSSSSRAASPTRTAPRSAPRDARPSDPRALRRMRGAAIMPRTLAGRGGSRRRTWRAMARAREG